MFNLDKKKTKELSDELFNKGNLSEIHMHLYFKGHMGGSCTSTIKYVSGSISGEKRVIGETLQELLEKVELFVNELK